MHVGDDAEPGGLGRADNGDRFPVQRPHLRQQFELDNRRCTNYTNTLFGSIQRIGMSTHLRLAGLLCAIWSIASCTEHPTPPVSSLNAQAIVDEQQLEPLRSFLITPGAAIGPISIGMSASDFRQAMGKPSCEPSCQDAVWERPPYTWYKFAYDRPDAELLAALDARSTRVSAVIAHAIWSESKWGKQPVKTATGVGPGSSKLDVLADLGNPDMEFPAIRGIATQRWCYKSGLIIWLIDQTVYNIAVGPEDCSHDWLNEMLYGGTAFAK
jgi:hypothetical protein